MSGTKKIKELRAEVIANGWDSKYLSTLTAAELRRLDKNPKLLKNVLRNSDRYTIQKFALEKYNLPKKYVNSYTKKELIDFIEFWSKSRNDGFFNELDVQTPVQEPEPELQNAIEPPSTAIDIEPKLEQNTEEASGSISEDDELSASFQLTDSDIRNISNRAGPTEAIFIQKPGSSFA